MILHINNDTTLRDVQSSFSNTFPYLKIEFLISERVTGLKEYSPDLPLYQIQKKKLFPNLIQIQPWYKYVEVENLFLTMFGLSVKLFRRNELGWVEAPHDLPVEEINKIARHSAEYYFKIKQEKQIHIW